MREIILDTETTGLKPEEGHRIIEIGCVELINQIPSGRTYQQYINPHRDVSEEAFKISGLSTQFLSTFPPFSKIAQEFLEFVGKDTLVIHNAPFDIRFLNSELGRLQLPLFSFDNVIDTLQLARSRFPGSPNSLDALCKRYQIDFSHREKHGALLDCELLAQVYLELKGGRQRGFSFQMDKKNSPQHTLSQPRPHHPPRPYGATDQERQAHEELVQQLINPLWKNG